MSVQMSGQIWPSSNLSEPSDVLSEIRSPRKRKRRRRKRRRKGGGRGSLGGGNNIDSSKMPIHHYHLSRAFFLSLLLLCCFSSIQFTRLVSSIGIGIGIGHDGSRAPPLNSKAAVLLEALPPFDDNRALNQLNFGRRPVKGRLSGAHYPNDPIDPSSANQQTNPNLIGSKLSTSSSTKVERSRSNSRMALRKLKHHIKRQVLKGEGDADSGEIETTTNMGAKLEELAQFGNESSNLVESSKQTNFRLRNEQVSRYVLELRQKYQNNRAFGDRTYYLLLSVYSILIVLGTLSNSIICLTVSCCSISTMLIHQPAFMFIATNIIIIDFDHNLIDQRSF